MQTGMKKSPAVSSIGFDDSDSDSDDLRRCTDGQDVTVIGLDDDSDLDLCEVPQQPQQQPQQPKKQQPPRHHKGTRQRAPARPPSSPQRRPKGRGAAAAAAAGDGLEKLRLTVAQPDSSVAPQGTFIDTQATFFGQTDGQLVDDDEEEDDTEEEEEEEVQQVEEQKAAPARAPVPCLLPPEYPFVWNVEHEGYVWALLGRAHRTAVATEAVRRHRAAESAWVHEDACGAQEDEMLQQLCTARTAASAQIAAQAERARHTLEESMRRLAETEQALLASIMTEAAESSDDGYDENDGGDEEEYDEGGIRQVEDVSNVSTENEAEETETEEDDEEEEEEASQGAENETDESEDEYDEWETVKLEDVMDECEMNPDPGFRAEVRRVLGLYAASAETELAGAERDTVARTVRQRLNQVSGDTQQIQRKIAELDALLRTGSAARQAGAVRLVVDGLLAQVEDQVTPHEDSAFWFAAVAVGLAAHTPRVLDTLVGGFYRACALAVPCVPPRTLRGRARLLGERAGEAPERGIERTCGLLALFFAVLQTRAPAGGTNAYGLPRAQQWLRDLLAAGERVPAAAVPLAVPAALHTFWRFVGSELCNACAPDTVADLLARSLAVARRVPAQPGTAGPLRLLEQLCAEHRATTMLPAHRSATNYLRAVTLQPFPSLPTTTHVPHHHHHHH